MKLIEYSKQTIDIARENHEVKFIHIFYLILPVAYDVCSTILAQKCKKINTIESKLYRTVIMECKALQELLKQRCLSRMK